MQGDGLVPRVMKGNSTYGEQGVMDESRLLATNRRCLK